MTTKLNLISDSVTAANARFMAVSMNAIANLASDVTWATTIVNEGGGSFDGTSYTIPADGEYEISVQADINLTVLPSTNSGTDHWRIRVQKNNANHFVRDNLINRNKGLSFKDTFAKGDTIKVRLEDGGIGYAATGGQADRTHFSVKRCSEFTAGGPVGFGLATPTTYGLVRANSVVFEGHQGSFIAGNVSSSGTLFNSTALEAGETYDIRVAISGEAADATSIVSFLIRDGGAGGTTFKTLQLRKDTAAGDAQSYYLSTEYRHTFINGEVTVTYVQGSTGDDNIFGNSPFADSDTTIQVIKVS